MIISRRREGVKTWRLSYLAVTHGAHRHRYFSFLTVKEALDHVRLMGVNRFHLEDHIDLLHRTH